MNLDRRLLALVDRRLYLRAAGAGFAAHLLQLALAWCLAHALSGGLSLTLGIAAALLLIGRAAALGASERGVEALAVAAKAAARARLWRDSVLRGVGEAKAARVAAFVQGVEGLTPYFQRYLPQVGLSMAAPLVTLLLVLAIDPLSALLLLITGPLLPLFMALIGRKTGEISRKEWGALVSLGERLFDLLGALNDLVLLGAAGAQIERLKAESERFRQAASEVLRWAAASALALELVATLSTAIVAVQVGLRLLAGHIEFEPALLVLLLAPEFYQPFRLLGARFHAGMSGISAIEALTPPEYTVGERAAPEGAIQLESLTIKYPGDPNRAEAISSISLEIKEGHRLAVWGRSGAGKSTLARALMGELRATEGQISIGETSLGEIDPRAWRDEVAYVPQEPQILGATFREALQLAAPSAAQAEMEAATRAARAHAFIMARPGGYASPIGAEGARLSGGERRRLALAQALLRGAPLVILDEPTAHLDAEARAQVLEALSELRPRRALVLITHDPQAAALCDEVARLEGGRLLALTPPERLPRALPKPPAARRLVGGHAQARPQRALLPLLWLILSRPWILLLSVTLGALTVGAGVGLLGVAGALIAAAAAHPPLAALQMMILGVRAFGTLRGFLRYGERLASHDLSFSLVARLRAQVAEGLAARAPLTALRKGEVLARIVGDVEALERLFVEGIAPPLVALLVLLGVTLIQATAGWGVALITAAGLLSAGLLAVVMALLSGPRGRAEAEALSRLSGAVEGGLDALYCVDAAAVEAHVRVPAEALEAAQARAGALEAWSAALHELLRWGTVAGALLLASDLPLVPRVGHALVALAAFEATAPLSGSAIALGRQLRAAARLFDLAAPIEAPTPQPLRPGPAEIRAEGLRFAYEGAAPLFEDLSFTVPAGGVAALVGPSGVGKTTLARLLMGLGTPDAGRLEVGGVEARSVPRGEALLLSQSPRFIEGTARENLTLGAARTDAQLDEAARLAGLSEVIAALPEGYETPLGAHGQRLSGGERQRLALARLLLRAPRLVILDEPTAHLDAETAEALVGRLREALVGRVTLVWLGHDPPGWIERVVDLERRALT